MYIPPADRGTIKRFGHSVGAAIRNSGKRIALFASADLSHALRTGAPAGFHPRGAEFDQTIRQLLEHAPADLLALEPSLTSAARQCGYPPLVALISMLDTLNYRVSVLSYEAPFGVGHLTASVDLA
jgi:aromatic ring-opening dioxygenase LigB subunit